MDLLYIWENASETVIQPRENIARGKFARNISYPRRKVFVDGKNRNDNFVSFLRKFPENSKPETKVL